MLRYYRSLYHYGHMGCPSYARAVASPYVSYGHAGHASTCLSTRARGLVTCRVVSAQAWSRVQPIASCQSEDGQSPLSLCYCHQSRASMLDSERSSPINFAHLWPRQ